MAKRNKQNKQNELDDIRAQIRKARRQIPANYAVQASYKISERLGESPSYQQADVLAGFLPFDGELSPLPLMDRAIQEGKRVFVPKIVSAGQPMKFVPWTREARTVRSRLGFEEPAVDDAQAIEGSAVGFVLVPLVAFDEQLNRIGFGGGFYDRTFEFTKLDGTGVTLMGVGFEMQKLPRITPHSWDVRLDGVVTELDFYESI